MNILKKVIKGFAYDALYDGIDSVTNTPQSITYEHHEIHSGDHYECIDVVDLSINNVRDIRITTPNTAKWGHFVFALSVESETDIYFHRNVSLDTIGTATTPLNNNHNSGNTSDVALDIIDNTSVALANEDTDLSGGTEILHYIAGAGKDAGETDRNREFILLQDTVYNIRLIANSAGFVNYVLQ